jgi:very-short-patch-repair endonuclease
VITTSYRRRPPGLRTRRDRLLPDEVTTVGGIAVTTAPRTAYDLARHTPLVDGVLALDALARVHPFDMALLRELDRRHLGARGSRRLVEVLRLADPLSGSPMETRIRLAVVRGGLPVPLLQHPVGPYFLDLAYPAIRLAIEYDGRDHLDPARALRDLDRQAYLTGAGWRVLRFRAAEVYRPVVVANRVRRELVDHARRRGLTVPAVLALIDAKAA